MNDPIRQSHVNRIVAHKNGALGLPTIRVLLWRLHGARTLPQLTDEQVIDLADVLDAIATPEAGVAYLDAAGTPPARNPVAPPARNPAPPVPAAATFFEAERASLWAAAALGEESCTKADIECRMSFTVEPGSALDVQVGGNHYKNFVYQPAEIAEKNHLTFLEACVVKRLHRHSRGGKGLQDIEKSIHELRLLAKLQYDADL